MHSPSVVSRRKKGKRLGEREMRHGRGEKRDSLLDRFHRKEGMSLAEEPVGRSGEGTRHSLALQRLFGPGPRSFWSCSWYFFSIRAR
jgi:hypothetical protein